MASQIDDKFLMELVREISILNTNVSAIQKEMDKIENRFLDPFTDVVHQVKALTEKLDILKTDIIALQTQATTQTTQIGTQNDDTKKLSHRMDNIKYYIAGFIAAISAVGFIAYKIFDIWMKLH